MVIRNRFSGAADAENWKTRETIALPTKSETETNSYYHYPVWSKIIFDAIYKTLVDAGYSPIKNEEFFLIDLWGFKFYVLSNNISNSYFTPNIAVNGTTLDFYNSSAYMNTSNSEAYNFSLTLRGNDDMVYLYISRGTDLTEYPVLWLAKSIYTPTNEEAFLFYNGIPNNTGYIIARLKSDLYNSVGGSYFGLANISSTDDVYAKDFGIGVGYSKIPQMTTRFEFIVKGMIFTNSMLVTAGNYYKLGNEIYYADTGNFPFLYKVDTVSNS